MKKLKSKGIRIGTLIGVALLIAVLLVVLLPGGIVITPVGIPSLDSGVVLASPETEVRQPDGDISAGSWTTAPLWSQIDEGSGSPDGTYILCPGNKNSTGEVSVQDPSNSGNYTAVQVKVFARKDVAGGHQRGLDADIRIATNLQGQQTLSAALSETFTEYTYTWSGLSFSQSDMNTLQVLFISTGVISAPPGDRRQVHIDYYEIILTYTPALPADITNAPGSYGFGVLAEGAANETGLTYFTVTNNSSFNVTITIGGTDMVGGVTWTLSDTATPGTDTYGLKAGLEGSDYTIIVKKAGGNILVSNLLGGGSTQDWGLKIWAPTLFTGGGVVSGNVTLTATQS